MNSKLEAAASSRGDSVADLAERLEHGRVAVEAILPALFEELAFEAMRDGTGSHSARPA